MGMAERVFCLPIGLTVEVGQVVASHDGYHCVDIGGRNVGLSLFDPVRAIYHYVSFSIYSSINSY